jgi:LuxR family transcriptional activator of bioluminescence operon
MSERIRASIRRFETSEALTEQELICLSLSARGQTSGDIGMKLGITPRTVNFHFSKILKKLNAMNRQEAIAKALSTRLIEPPYRQE